MSAKLTKRETQVMRAWAARPDATRHEHAELMGISVRTFDTHSDNARKKLGVQTRLAAVLTWLRQNRLLKLTAALVLVAGCTTPKIDQPPLPPKAKMNFQAATYEAPAVVWQPAGASIPLPNYPCMVTMYNAQWKPVAQWHHDPDVFSPNIVVDDSAGSGFFKFTPDVQPQMKAPIE